ncbi:MAG: nucleotide pyrophosphohydrolase [Candidatus Hodarchaeales archaeon]
MSDIRNDSNTTLDFLKNKAQEFVDEREWRKFHSPKNLVMSIAIEAAELMEVFQWLTVSESIESLQKEEILDKIREELADVMVYCISLANTTNIDITESILEKMRKNDLKYPAELFRGRF